MISNVYFQKKKLNFDKFGVTVIKSFFNNKEIKELETKINDYIEKSKKKLEGKDINFIKNEINSIHKFKDSFFDKFSKQKKIIQLSSIMVNDKPVFRMCEYFAKPKRIGLASPIHQDNYYWNLKGGKALTIWLAIDKATKENGSVQYLLGSHKEGLVDHVPSYAPGSSQKIKQIKKFKKKYKLKSFLLNKGDCLIHDSLVMHGSKKNISSNSRRGFTVQIKAKKTKIDHESLQKYRKSLKLQLKKRKLKS